MKRLCILLSFVVLAFQLAAQTTSLYGSNNGNYATIKGTKIYYEEYGNGVPLLLLHGGLGSIADFQLVIPELSKHFKVIAFDRPGHGRSEQADSLSYHIMADYTSRLIDQLGLDSLYVLGWSDGGSTGLLLNQIRPEKVKKIIVCGTGYDDSDTTTSLGFLSQFSPEFVEKNWKKAWLDDYKSKSPQPGQWKKFINDMKKLWTNNDIITQIQLGDLKSSVLIVLGDNDALKIEHCVKMHRLIKGSQLSILPATTHFVFSERPALITQQVIEFLNTR